MNYEILHLRDDHMRTRGFLPLELLGAVDLNQYQVVYGGEIADMGRDQVMLEVLFTTFNLHHPADYHAHSMSVGDLVLLDNVRRQRGLGRAEGRERAEARLADRAAGSRLGTSIKLTTTEALSVQAGRMDGYAGLSRVLLRRAGSAGGKGPALR